MVDEFHASGEGPEIHALAIDFTRISGVDLFARWDPRHAFWDARLAKGLDPHFRISIERTGPECHVLTRGQEGIFGVNFAAQDYLSLSSHPTIRQVAADAIERWGVHGSGPIEMQGASVPLVLLEERLAEILCCREAAVFPTGWAASYGAIRALMREHDHVVIDSLAHDSLQQGAVAATRNVHRVPHCSYEALAACLAKIRADNATAGILVVTQSLFQLNASVPDLRTVRDACRAHDATLLVNVSHDFGAIGDGGLGFIGAQRLIGEVDVVVGSFAKTFASNGGFVASRNVGLRQALRANASPWLCSSTLSPLQASVILAALDVVRSREGAQRRRRLMKNSLRLRESLESRAFQVLGRPGALVPVLLGDVGRARLMTRFALNNGGLVALVEHPAVSRMNSNWRLHVMADHTAEQIDRIVTIAVAAREQVPSAGDGIRGESYDPPPELGCSD